MQISWIYVFISHTKVKCSYTHIKSPVNEKNTPSYNTFMLLLLSVCSCKPCLKNFGSLFGKWWVIMYMARIGCYFNPKDLLTTLIYEWLDWYSRDVISSSSGNLYPQSHDNRIALKFDRHPDSVAAEVLVKFHRDYQRKNPHSRSVVEKKHNLQCPKLKIHNRIDRNVSFINISKFIKTLRVSVIMLWWYGMCVCIQ